MGMTGTAYTQHEELSGAPFLALQLWEPEVAVDGSGPGSVLRLRLSSPTISGGSSPVPLLVGEGVKVPWRVRCEQTQSHPLLWMERCSLMVLPCGTVPCLCLFPGQVPPSLLKAERVSSESPSLPWYVEVSQNGQPGSLAVVHPSCRGRGSLFPLLCLRKDRRAPSHPQPLGTNVCAPTRDSPGPLAQYTSMSHPCSKRPLPSPPALGREATLWLAPRRRICCSALSLWSWGLFPFVFSL